MAKHGGTHMVSSQGHKKGKPSKDEHTKAMKKKSKTKKDKK